MELFHQMISGLLGIPERQISSTLHLLGEGATLAQHGQIFRVGVQARVTGHAAVCHPCIAVVALALQGCCR